MHAYIYIDSLITSRAIIHISVHVHVHIVYKNACKTSKIMHTYAEQACKVLTHTGLSQVLSKYSVDAD